MPGIAGFEGVSVLSSVSRLSGKEFNGYLVIKLPHELDAVVERVVDEYRSGSEAARRQMLDEISPRTAGVLSAFGQRAASMAVRARSVEVLMRGLVAVGMAESRLEDYRNNLFVLAAVNDSAEVLGRRMGELLDVIGPELPADARETLRKFDARQPSDKSLQSMGLRVIGSGDSFLYR